MLSLPNTSRTQLLPTTPPTTGPSSDQLSSRLLQESPDSFCYFSSCLSLFSILNATPVWIFHQPRSVYSFADIHQWLLRPYTLWLPPWHLPEVTFRLPSPDLVLLFSVQRKDCPCLRGLPPDGSVNDKRACQGPLPPASVGTESVFLSCWLLTHTEGSSGWRLSHFVLQENWWNWSLHWYFQDFLSPILASPHI